MKILSFVPVDLIMIQIRRHEYMQKLCMYKDMNICRSCVCTWHACIYWMCEFVVPELACIIINKKSGLIKTKEAGQA